MTVTTTTASQTFQGNSTATAFPCAFEIFEDTDINVYFVNPATGTQTQAVLNTDYTVVGAGASAGFTVNTTVAVPTGTNLYVVRALPLTQLIDLTNQGAFFPTLHEAAFDRLCMQIQQIANYSEGLNVTMPPGLVPQPSTLFPIPQAGSLIGWNAAGNALVNTGPTTGVGGISDVNVATNAGVQASKLSFLQVGAGAVSRTVASKLSDTISVKDFGAVGDGVADDTAAIQAAVNAMAARSPHGTVWLPSGTFLVSGPINVNYSVRIEGAGPEQTSIKTTSATANLFTLDVTGAVTGTVIGGFTAEASSLKTAGYVIQVVSTAGTGALYSAKFHDINVGANVPYAIDVVTAQHLVISDISVANCGQNGAAFNFQGTGTGQEPNDVFITRCVVETGTVGTTTTGLHIGSYAQGVYVDACTFETYGLNYDILLDDVLGSSDNTPKNVFLRNVICDASTTAALQVNACKGLYIANSWFNSSKGTGVNLTKGDDLSFHNCTLINNGLYGAQIQSTATTSRFIGCVFDVNVFTGIYARAGSTGFTISGCQFWRAGSTPTHTYSIAIEAGASDRFVITGNNLYGFTSQAIANSATGTHTVVANNITS